MAERVLVAEHVGVTGTMPYAVEWRHDGRTHLRPLGREFHVKAVDSRTGEAVEFDFSMRLDDRGSVCVYRDGDCPDEFWFGDELIRVPSVGEAP